MKKIILFLSVLAYFAGIQAQSQPTSDYLYTTGLEYDGEFYYFDVCLQGENIYTAYGVDIQLPNGLEVSTDDGEPEVYRISGIYPTNKAGEFYHTVSPEFPTPSDHTHLRVGCMASGNKDLNASSGALFRVYVNNTCTSTQWPIGAIKLYDVELNKVGQPYNSPNQNKLVTMFEGTSTLPLNVSAVNHWSTCILPFATAIPAGVKAYTSSTSDSENIYLTEARSIEAYTPYILYSENGYSGNVSGTVDASGYPENGIVTMGNLTGAIVPQTVTDGYILQKQNDVVQFYAIASGDSFLVPAGKCWMNIAGNNAKAFNFVIEDDETAIRSISTTTADDTTYDLTGRRISTTKQGGIYIKNGKKVMK